MNARYTYVAVSAAILLLAAVALSSFDAGHLSASSRPSLSDLELKDLDGSPVRISDHRGKVVVLNFWATWCPPCLQELPHFKSAYGDYDRTDVEFLGASLDAMPPYNMPTPALRKFVEARGLPYPIVTADQAVLRKVGAIQDIPTVFQGMEDSPVTEDGSVSGIPTTFFIDTNGRIHHKYVGYMPKTYLVSQIERLLQES